MKPLPKRVQQQLKQIFKNGPKDPPKFVKIENKYKCITDFDFKVIKDVNTQCFPCDMDSFDSFKNLWQHLKYQHRINNLYACEICEIFFISKSKLSFHKKTACKPLDYSCHECSESFSTRKGLSSHIVNKHKNSSLYQCDICNIKISNQV